MVFSNTLNYNKRRKERYYDSAMSNAIEGTIVVTIKNIPGEFEIDSRSDILKRILLTKEYEPEIVTFILKSIANNKDVINIGANIGLYANLLADNIHSNRVLAIEPTTKAYELLIKNIDRNHNTNKIIAYKGIATNMEGDFEINTIHGKEEYSSIGSLVHDATRNEIYSKEKVIGNKLDTLILKYGLIPGLIVIDVEGAEMKVLLGAKASLEKYRPIIISELDDTLLTEQNTSSKHLISFLQGLNYSVKSIDGEKPTYPFSGNVIAIPNK